MEVGDKERYVVALMISDYSMELPMRLCTSRRQEKVNGGSVLGSTTCAIRPAPSSISFVLSTAMNGSPYIHCTSFLSISSRSDLTKLTGIGFLLRITNPSARIIINLVNFLHKIFSISSACFIAILNRMEFTEGSIRTRSDSFRETVSG